MQAVAWLGGAAGADASRAARKSGRGGAPTHRKRLAETAKATPAKIRCRRCCGSEERLVQMPAEQRGSSGSSRPAGWSDGMCGRRPIDARMDFMYSDPTRAEAPGSLRRRRPATAATW
ncbi:hypothetical protein Syun_001370 [Stephania yunnanensis]|uniref:Uncharacterized protein n=1 Tax=Stephania yunnanensis TaxID=152371 RepID=A0AAP0LGI5_9MAGN